MWLLKSTPQQIASPVSNPSLYCSPLMIPPKFLPSSPWYAHDRAFKPGQPVLGELPLRRPTATELFSFLAGLMTEPRRQNGFLPATTTTDYLNLKEEVIQPCRNRMVSKSLNDRSELCYITYTTISQRQMLQYRAVLSRILAVISSPSSLKLRPVRGIASVKRLGT